jgi:hypothetical protein
MGRCGHSKEGPKIEPLFAMTNSQFLSKKLVHYNTLNYSICQPLSSELAL